MDENDILISLKNLKTYNEEIPLFQWVEKRRNLNRYWKVSVSFVYKVRNISIYWPSTSELIRNVFTIKKISLPLHRQIKINV